jgi:ParB family chromosome partitioning protein
MVLRIKPISPLPDLAGLDAGGQPRLLPIESIDEDPEQPRREFDDESLAELAATIRARGVRSPVSVRSHPSVPGRWMLNFGARRLRASKLAARSDIPAFVDEAFDSYDQVIENEQREGLKPLEIALFIKRQLDRGHSRMEIARGIGKSPSYVSVASALIDAPDWLMDAYRARKCRGMFELCELRRLHSQDADAVEAWLADVEAVGRVELRRLKQQLGDVAAVASKASVPSGTGADGRAQTIGESTPSGRHEPITENELCAPAAVHSVVSKRFERFKSDENSHAVGNAVVCERLDVEALHDGKKVRIVLDELPRAPSTVYVVSEMEGRVIASVKSLGGIELIRRAGPGV